MRAWAAALERELVGFPRPTDAPQTHSPGVESDRILVFGGGLAVGWGVFIHDLALPGSLARALSARTGRGVDVDLLSDPRTAVRSALGALDGQTLWRYAAIVVILGIDDARNLTSVRVWRRELSKVLRLLERDSSQRTQIFMVGLYPIRSVPVFDTPLGSVAERHARALNRVTTEICAELPRTTFVPLTATPSPSPGRFRTAADYGHWAGLLANSMAAPLNAQPSEIEDAAGELVLHDSEALERARQCAVEELGILDTNPGDRISRIVALAQRSFGTLWAAFTVIDRDRAWLVAGAGVIPKEIPRSLSFCTVTIQKPRPMVVPDALADVRFRDKQIVRSAAHVRFYAGFPVESPSGERIGALCVYDPEPRPTSEVNQVLLRELALMVQRELWDRQSRGDRPDLDEGDQGFQARTQTSARPQAIAAARPRRFDLARPFGPQSTGIRRSLGM